MDGRSSDGARDIVAAYEHVVGQLGARQPEIHLQVPADDRVSEPLAGEGEADPVQEMRVLAGQAAHLARGAAALAARFLQQFAGSVGVAPLRPPGPAEPAPPSLRLPSASAGTASAGVVVLRNPTLNTMDDLKLGSDGFVASGGSRIDAIHVHFKPEVVELAPGASSRVTVSVDVPGSTRRGHYLGLLTVAGRPATQLLVTLDVV